MGKVRFDPNLSLILVDVLVAGIENETGMMLLLAFDTGASVTTISYDLMEYLGYEPEKSRRIGRLITGSGVEYAPIITVRRISVGREYLDNIEVYCHNFPAESYVDGVLGLNFLRHFNFNVLYDQGEIELVRRTI